MQQFVVDPAVFEVLPTYRVGVVVARGLDNRGGHPAVARLLDEAVARFAETHREVNVRELPGVKACRDAFQVLGMNPNKFMCSIEALMKRVQKGGALPHINPVVDLGNAFSLTYQLPMGAHDLDKAAGDLCVRFSTEKDLFLPMGVQEVERPGAGELVYASGTTVKTRRWIWRQSEDGKIDEATSRVVFPIDGFADVNGDAVLGARDALAAFVGHELGCEVSTALVDRENPTALVG